MFNTQHVIYMVVSFALTAGLLVLAGIYVKDQKRKNLILKVSALATVFLHYSNLWVEYFTTGSATVESGHILLVYPCNVIMWMLLLVAFMKKQGTLFTLVSEFCVYGGIVCGLVGIIFNKNFDSTPTFADYDVLKGMLSHSTFLFGCLYLIVGKYFRVRVFNAVSITAGLAFFVVCGLITNQLFVWFGLEVIDGMFLLENPYIPVSPILLGILAVFLIFGILALYELKFPKEERWYSKLQARFRKIKK